MTSGRDTASFFENGNTKQFEYCFKMYPQVLKLKAEKRCKKPQELIRLDQWYQNELPKLIKQRGKDAHMVYDELVQTMKWKQSRGKFYPQLSYLVKVNTPRAVMQETKKAFRKLPNLEQAITALSNLKGVGTTMASALLAAAAPDKAPFMADECLMAIPEIEGIDYTTKEYLNFVQHIQVTTARLNSEVGGDVPVWSPHRVELALWSHYVAADLSPDLLDNMPGSGPISITNGVSSSSTITAADADTDVDEDTMPGDETMGTGTATESETENITDEPSSTLEEIVTGSDTTMMVQEASSATNSNTGNNSNNTNTRIISDNDADSNFISNDSTSQDPIIDENTTHTTATTTTDDGGTPLASDSESNIDAPAPPLIRAAAVGKTTTVTTTLTTKATTEIETTSICTNNPNKNVNNGNGAIIDSVDGEENAISCLLRSDEDDTNSRSKSVTPIINMNDATNDSTSGTATTTTTLSSSIGKRSLNCDSSEDQSNSQPEIKKIRTD